MTKPEVIDIATARLPAHNRPRKRGGGPGGPDDMESRLAKLEAHAEHMQTGIGEIKGDLKDVSKDVQAIRVRLAWGSGAAAVIIGLLAWLANNRFDQVVEMITK